MTTILRNTTAGVILIDDVGFVLPVGSSTIETMNLPLWANSASVVPYISSGSVVVNNGTIDLSPTDGIRFLLWPDRLTVQQASTDVTRVVTSINFTGGATATDNGNGAVTVNVAGGSPPQLLREATAVVFPGAGFISAFSGLLFEADPENDTILFMGEEDL